MANITHRQAPSLRPGLNYIAEPSSPPGTLEGTDERRFTLDIIALHGFIANFEDSWVSKTTGFFWLRDALPQRIPTARILAYNYRGPPEIAVDALITALVEDRTSKQRNTVPILLIGHSLGGTLAKQLFLSSAPSRTPRSDYHNLHAAIKGFIFIGTRHRGQYKLVDWWRAIPYLKTWASTLKDALIQTPRINHDFQMLSGEALLNACFWEGQPTFIVGILVSKEDAILNIDGPENHPIVTKHEDMCRFDDEEDQNCKQILSAIRNITETIKNQVDTEDSNVISVPAAQSLRLLSLDGGGVRGLFSIIVLQHIMEEIRRIDRPNDRDAPKPCEYFEFMTGTSTGGILAIMLGRLRMDVASCRAAYKSLSEGIFKRPIFALPGQTLLKRIFGYPKFPAGPLVDAVKSVVSDTLSLPEAFSLRQIRNVVAAEAPLRPITLPPTTGEDTKVIVCAGVQGSTICNRIRSYSPSHINRAALFPQNCKIWEACRATSAAPSYFPPITIEERNYFDGGLKSNNPILEAVDEALLENPGSNFRAIISIGTGRAPYVEPGQSLLSIVNWSIAEVTNTQAKHEEFRRRYPNIVAYSEDEHITQDACYFRFNEEIGLYQIDLSDWQKLPHIERMAEQYVSAPRVSRAIRRCAAKLANSTSGLVAGD